MNIDIIVAKLVRKGFTETRAKEYAIEVNTIAAAYNVSPSYLVDQLSSDFKLNDLGAFLVNSALRFGYKTGTMKNRTPNKYIARAIIR
ncbi:hypothetical protein N9R43_01870 [bacterium]|nr:hypothetical protein [bacterium]